MKKHFATAQIIETYQYQIETDRPDEEAVNEAAKQFGREPREPTDTSFHIFDIQPA